MVDLFGGRNQSREITGCNYTPEENLYKLVRKLQIESSKKYGKSYLVVHLGTWNSEVGIRKGVWTEKGEVEKTEGMITKKNAGAL